MEPVEKWDRGPYSEDIAANIRAERHRAGLNQKRLAKRMQALGFKTWAWQTVGKVENDNRPVLATELLGLCLCLNTTMPALLAPPEADHLVELKPGFGVGSVTVRRLAVGILSEFTRAIEWDGDDSVIASQVFANPGPHGASAGTEWFTQFWAGEAFTVRAVAGDPKKGSDE